MEKGRPGRMGDFVHEHDAAFISAAVEGYQGPPFGIRLWDGWSWFSRPGEKPVSTIVLANPEALGALIAHPTEVTLGKAYIHGDLDVEGDLFSAFEVAEYLFRRPRAVRQRVAEKMAGTVFSIGRWLKRGRADSENKDRASIAYHYDLPVTFFEPWLGSSLVYSCAYFTDPKESLDTAQEQKLDLICRKLRLKPGEHFLDIGCGWGSLVLRAGGRWHARAEGITLSREQATTGERRIAEAGLADCCSIEMRDYRNLHGKEKVYDKIASIGMFEHVGLKNLPPYFKIAHRLLRPGGLFLNHGIARSDTSPIRESSFISRYVFPDGRLVTLSEALKAAESQGLEVRDVENLREHYDLTLRHWVAGLQENAYALKQLVSERTYRIWLLYTAGSAAAFRRGDIAVFQVLMSRPDRGVSRLPLTRSDWYAIAPARQTAKVPAA
jgi:cyclopropane-fatty-acyl-phospholipid synthase